MPDVLVSEIFGPTFQGEGPLIGRPAAFLRTAICNLACVWCDTPYTWNWQLYDRDTQVKPLSVDQVVLEVNQHLPRPTPWDLRPVLVITGGEPMLQQDRLWPVLDVLAGEVLVQVETAGTIPPREPFDHFVDLYVVSPKLAHSGNAHEKRYKPDALQALSATGRAVWKFVAQAPGDLPEAAEMVEELRLEGPVYVMPEGKYTEDLISRERGLAEAVLALGWRLTPRLHVDIWGTERGH